MKYDSLFDLNKYLREQSDPQYRDFNAKIIPTQYPILGVRVPILHKIAKTIAKGDYRRFIKENQHQTYEEVLLHGLVISYLKIDHREVFRYYDAFIPYIDNWALVDLTIRFQGLKQGSHDGFLYAKDKLKSDNPWEKRVGLVLILTFYIKEDTFDEVLTLLPKVESDHYYVKMAAAWLLSFCFLYDSKKTLLLLQKKKLDPWTHNKAISKICDSYRVSKEMKEYVKTLRISPKDHQ